MWLLVWRNYLSNYQPFYKECLKFFVKCSALNNLSIQDLSGKYLSKVILSLYSHMSDTVCFGPLCENNTWVEWEKKQWLKYFYCFFYSRILWFISNRLGQMSLLKRADHNSKSALIKTHQLIKNIQSTLPLWHIFVIRACTFLW